MSIVFSDVDLSSKGLNAIENAFGKVIYATSDPNTVQECGLPNDHKQTKWCVPSKFEHFAERIQNFKIRPDDVWLVGYLKSGTTWVQNIIWQLKNNLDYSASTLEYTHNLIERSVYHSATFDQFDHYDSMPSPRLFKSHLPVYLLPKELWTVRPKIIYTARNPKDIAVSLSHFANALYESTVSKEVIFDAFLSELIHLSPVHSHVLSFWELRNLDHVLFLKYEDLLTDQFNGVKQISKFLECSYSDKDLTNLVDHLSFNKMKDRVSMTTLDGVKMETAGYQ